MKRFKEKLKWTLIALGIVGIAVAGTLPTKIPVDLLLKTDKINIISSITKDGTVKYAYKTNQIEISPNEILDKRTSHSKTFLVESKKDKTIYETEIISGSPQYYKDENNVWWQADYATTTLDAFDKQTVSFIPKAYATDFYPHSGDGVIGNDNDSTWAAAHDTDPADSVVSDGTHNYIESEDIGGPRFRCSRIFDMFDTSAIGTDDVTAVVYGITSGAKGDGYGDSVHIVASTPASDTSLTTADFDQVGSVSFASKALSAITVEQYEYWTLNPAGIANIDGTGYSNFAVRLGYDVNNTNPSSSGTRNYFGMYMSENSGTTKDPKITVTHEAAAAPAEPDLIQIQTYGNW